MKVRVRPVSCSNGNVSNLDWIESDIITINQVNELIPNITRSNIPTCPIPATGSLSTTLQSDIPVDWYIKNENWWKNIQEKKYTQERLGKIL